MIARLTQIEHIDQEIAKVEDRLKSLRNRRARVERMALVQPVVEAPAPTEDPAPVRYVRNCMCCSHRIEAESKFIRMCKQCGGSGVRISGASS